MSIGQQTRERRLATLSLLGLFRMRNDVADDVPVIFDTFQPRLHVGNHLCGRIKRAEAATGPEFVVGLSQPSINQRALGGSVFVFGRRNFE